MAKAKLGAAAAPAKTYTVISSLEHDKVLYAVGEPVEMTPDQAKPLLGNTLEEQATAEEEQKA